MQSTRRRAFGNLWTGYGDVRTRILPRRGWRESDDPDLSRSAGSCGGLADGRLKKKSADEVGNKVLATRVVGLKLSSLFDWWRLLLITAGAAHRLHNRTDIAHRHQDTPLTAAGMVELRSGTRSLAGHHS